jgi:hypothetical protein
MAQPFKCIIIFSHPGVQKQAIALESQLAASQEPVFPDALALLNQQFDRIYVELEPARQDYEAREAAVNFLNDLFRNKLSGISILLAILILFNLLEPSSLLVS